MQRARKAIDQLTCTTIHGFAQKLIKPYPAEANIDPGAEIIDPGEADIAFDEHYQAWLRAHLAGKDHDGVVAELVVADERRGLKLLGELAQFLRRNRDARPEGQCWSRALVDRFIAAANAFADGLDGLHFREQQTDAACQAFIELAALLGRLSLQTAAPGNRALVEAVTLPRHQACFTQNGGQRALRTRGRWQQAAAAAGRSGSDGQQACDRANEHYQSAHAALEALFAAIGAELLARISAANE
jgi:exodeoxyribonuclease-5